MKRIAFGFYLFFLVFHLRSQGLESIIVEKYYTSDANDCKDTLGGILPIGSVTYRIYVDMKPGYALQAIYGVPKHELNIKTTTKFFNNTAYGEKTGNKIDFVKINNNTVALDSWVTIGAATKSHVGILKTEDKDGSILTRNSLTSTDGLMAKNIPTLVFYGNDLSFFNEAGASVFSTNDGTWSTLLGTKGPTPDNKVLIAQLTTDGKLSFELNMQLIVPTGGVEQYVAKNPEEKEIQFDGLTFKEN